MTYFFYLFTFLPFYFCRKMITFAAEDYFYEKTNNNNTFEHRQCTYLCTAGCRRRLYVAYGVYGLRIYELR